MKHLILMALLSGAGLLFGQSREAAPSKRVERDEQVHVSWLLQQNREASHLRGDEIVGTLSRELEASQSKTLVYWPEASAEERARFADPLPTGASVRVGLIELGQREDLKFPAALVSVEGQTPCIYLDREHKGRFEAAGRICFTPLALDYAHWGASASFDVTSGLYRTLPVEFQLPTAKLTDPHTGKTPTLLYNDTFLAKGTIEIGGRQFLVGYRYRAERGKLESGVDLQYSDKNGDSKLDESAERDLPQDGKAPVVHLGGYYLRSGAIDDENFTLHWQRVQASEYESLDLLPGATLPDFRLTMLDGSTRQLGQLKGKLTLLDFWATWCAACVADLTSKKAVYEHFHGEGFTIIGMDGSEENLSKPRALVAKLGLPWPEAKPSSELVNKRFQITVWPTAILIDDNMKILSLDANELRGDNLARTIERHFAGKK